MQCHGDQIEKGRQALLMNHQITDQPAVGGKPAQLKSISQSSSRFLFSAVCPRSRNHILQTVEKQEPDQGGRVNAVFREWQSAANRYMRENVLSLAHFRESPEKNISYRNACRGG